MRKILTIAACVAVFTATDALLADDPVTVTLPVPVTVTETTTTQTQTTTPGIESILIDLKSQEVGIKLVGVEARVVITGDTYWSVLNPHFATLMQAMRDALTAALAPLPSPTPAP